jgi:Fe-S-cluster containining protein
MAISESLVAPPDWRALLALEFVDEGPCHQLCGGGYCCNHARAEFQFQLIPHQGSTLFLLDGEYEYLRTSGQLPAEGWGQARHLRLDFATGRAVGLTLLHCSFLGKCGGHAVRPLHCRLYPFVPILDVAGEVEAIYPASVFDLTEDIMGWTSPCGIRHKEKTYLDLWRSDAERLRPLRHPYLMFYLSCYRALADSYRRKLAASRKLAGKQGAEFWKAWELLYLGGLLFDWPAVKAEMARSHAALRDRYGEFLAAPAAGGA